MPRARLRELLPDRITLAALGVARVLASLTAWSAGFRALSDDDYARLSIAQRFAHAPRFDPTGTSWLPAPFWVYGAAFRGFGSELAVARGTAIMLSVGATLLLYVAGRVLGGTPRAALLGALLATFLPYSALLGIAAVPEVPCAALVVFGAATLCSSDARLRAIAGGGLALACLSRYEAWPVAVAFSLYGAWDALRSRRGSQAIGALLALVGPALWLAVGHFAHGDPLFFIARVTAYRRALGANEQPLLQRLLQYPVNLLVGEPALPLLCAAGLFLVGRSAVCRELASFRRGVLVLFALLAFLMVGSVRDGVPTHHAARVLLPLWYFASLAIGRAATRASARSVRSLAVTLALVSSALLASIVMRARAENGETFAHRSLELAAGREAGRRSLPALAIDTPDFGYFAVQAAFGEPERTWVVNEHDPRRPGLGRSVLSAAELQARGLRYLVTSIEHAAPLASLCQTLWQRAPLALLDCGTQAAAGRERR